MIKDKLYEAAYAILKNSLLLEMAIAKKEYDKKVFNIFHKVIEHYMFIKVEPHSSAVGHWKNEILAFLAPIARSKYSHTNKYPKAADFIRHVENSGHEYTPEGFHDVYLMFKSEKKLPNISQHEFVRISHDFVLFLNQIATKIEKGILINQKDVV